MFFTKKNESSSSIGTEAELWAQTFLEQQGLTIITKNFHTARGEIDLIMYHGHTLVFVEVRLRSTNRYGNAVDSIDKRKQQRIISAAQNYLQSKGLWDQVQCRFDAICLDKDPDNNTQYRVEWLRNAFSA
jgi:putative endonuclease